MHDNAVVVVVGLGEVGKPLLSILRRAYDCIGVDVTPLDLGRRCSVLHICYPFQINDFVGTTFNYVSLYDPELVIINSTVAPNTSRELQSHLPNHHVVYSPIRGKHAKMESDLMRYTKFVAAFHQDALEAAVRHFATAGFKTDTFRTPEIAELSKLLETTYFGILIAWAQEMERFAAEYGATFDEVNRYMEEINFLPSHIFPGVIGGHCVMPNLSILRATFNSRFLAAIVESNTVKQEEALTSAA
jgi:UDP-N-acetyl-D-mannosaminuronate dehydrogenase